MNVYQQPELEDRRRMAGVARLNLWNAPTPNDDSILLANKSIISRVSAYYSPIAAVAERG